MSANDRYSSLQREYAANASNFDSRWKHYISASVDRTLAAFQLDPGTRLLDVGCGTGELLARLVAQQPATRLYGCDLSNPMLAVARDRLGPPIGLVQAAGEALPLANASIDVLVSTSVFHFVREPRKALLEARRVLRPGGMLVLTDWCGDYLTMKMFDAYLKAFDSAHHHTYRSAEFARLLEEHDFSDIHVSRYRVNWFWGLFTATAIST
ncbi:MAG: methyltransferase domain-containing protein [Wenzhouxiangella sp.]